MSTSLVPQSRAVLSRHARSFRWAAVFLPRDAADDAAVLYHLCRHVDDVVDEATDPDQATRDVEALRAELLGEVTPSPLVAAWLEVAERRGVPPEPMLDLVAAVASDLGQVRVKDDDELLAYCYGVAGTVGLMMCGVIGVTDREAWPHAVSLGIGMQLTNICRDVAEDGARGRTYLPASRLDQGSISEVVRDLLLLADSHYAEGRRGFRFIPLRTRLAIAVAAEIYQAIGLVLRARDCDPLRGRAVTSRLRKLLGVFRGLGRAVMA